MEEKIVNVNIDGEMKPMTIGERSGRQSLKIKSIAAHGTTVSPNGDVKGISGEQGILALEKEIETGIKKFPEGIKDFNELMDKISGKDLDMLQDKIRELNSVGDIPKKLEKP